MAKTTLADISGEGVLIANKNLIGLRMFIKSIRNIVSKWIGVYEIRARLYLWELSNTAREKKT